MTLLGARLASLFALFGLTILTGLGPVLLFKLWQRKQERKTILDDQNQLFGGHVNKRVNPKPGQSAKILQLLLVFGGGVLLSTCFVHMIPEIKENYETYLKNQENKTTTLLPVGETKHYNDLSQLLHPSNESKQIKDQEGNNSHKVPWVEISICVGLFLTYFIEEIILLLIGNSAHHHHHHDNQSHHHHSTKENIVCLPESGGLGDYGTIIRPVSSRGNDSATESRRPSIIGSLKNDDDDDDELCSISYQKTSNYLRESEHTDLWNRFLRGLIIVIAFLAHSIFDGVAIGLQTTTNSIWTLFFAICLHKLVVVFAIGFELFEKTGSLLLTSIHITIFSLMSPLGILIAIFTEQGLSEDSSLTLILLNAVATGAILYIVFLEILQADRCPEINGLTQLAALVTGFILMTCMTVLVSDGD